MSSPILPASAGVLALTISYAITCTAWPFGPCRRCDGAGSFKSPRGRFRRQCRRCHGTGLRLRYGVRLRNYLARLNRDAHK